VLQVHSDSCCRCRVLLQLPRSCVPAPCTVVMPPPPPSPCRRSFGAHQVAGVSRYSSMLLTSAAAPADARCRSNRHGHVAGPRLVRPGSRSRRVSFASRCCCRCSAAAAGNDDELARLLRGVNDPNLADYDGRTALVPPTTCARVPLVLNRWHFSSRARAAPRCVRGPQVDGAAAAGCLRPRQRHRQIRRCATDTCHRNCKSDAAGRHAAA